MYMHVLQSACKDFVCPRGIAVNLVCCYIRLSEINMSCADMSLSIKSIPINPRKHSPKKELWFEAMIRLIIRLSSFKQMIIYLIQ